jgi:hypothetical protein
VFQSGIGVFAQSQKVTVNFVVCVCPSACLRISTELPMDGFFAKFNIGVILLKLVDLD